MRVLYTYDVGSQDEASMDLDAWYLIIAVVSSFTKPV